MGRWDGKDEAGFNSNQPHSFCLRRKHKIVIPVTCQAWSMRRVLNYMLNWL